jgi:hypothetical protein
MSREQIGGRIVTDGLVLMLDAGNEKSYPGTGTTLSDLSGNGNDGSLNGTYSYSSGTIRLSNTSTNNGLNISFIQLPTISAITTVCLWYRVERNMGSTARYLLDMRTGGAGGWIYSGSTGSNWSSGTAYVNNGSSASIVWSNIEVSFNQWQFTTVIANSPATDDMNLFSRYTDNEGYDVTFGSACIYNRVLTADEISQNFKATRHRFGL